MCVCGGREGWEEGNGNLGELGCAGWEGGIVLSGVLPRRLGKVSRRTSKNGMQGWGEVGDRDEGRDYTVYYI